MKRILILVLSVLLMVLTLVSCIETNIEDTFSRGLQNTGTSDNPALTYEDESSTGEDDEIPRYVSHSIRTVECIVNYPAIIKVMSKEEIGVRIISTSLNSYETPEEVWYALEEHEAFTEAVSRYNDEYFEDNMLVFVFIESESGMIEYSCKGVEDSGIIHIQKEVPTGGLTEEVAYWHIIIELPKKHPAIVSNAELSLDITEAYSGIELPSDFSFSLVWSTYGISSYDSQTGKLVKTKDATDVSKYTDYVKLSRYKLEQVYKYLFMDIDITEYPNIYDPFYNPENGIGLVSEPSQTIIITATANGITKTITCEDIAFGSLDEGYGDEGKSFLSAIDNITALLTSLPEWKAFPDYEFLYD